MVGSLFKMSSDDVVHRIKELESRMDRVCKFIGGMYWSSYLEEFKSLEHKVIGLDKRLDAKISEVKDKMEKEVKTKVDKLETKMEEEVKSKVDKLETKMEKEVKTKVDRLETKITEEVSVIVDKYKDCERKKELAKEVFSVNMKNNMAQIRVKDENIKGASSDCLEGLSLIMKEYGNVSLEDCFRDCKNLTTLNFPSTFNTSNVTNMSWMFYGCSSLSSLDLSTFNTSNVTDMGWMFFGCKSLSSLDLSTFNTGSVRNMKSMFSGCNSLSSLNLSTFNTSNVIRMAHMFNGCSSLSSLNLAQASIELRGGTTLDISTFNTSNALYMNNMFHGCSSLNSLDLSTFSTSNARSVEDMFSRCSKLNEVYVKDEMIRSKLPDGVSVKTK